MVHNPTNNNKYDHLPFRQNAEAIILNEKNEILIVSPTFFSKRHWQCPGGGINDGEQAIDAIKREIKEELGTEKVRLIKQSEGRMNYIWPEHHIQFHEEKYKGQSKTFFIFRFLGVNSDIKLNRTENKSWKWIRAEKLESVFKYRTQAEFIQDILDDPEIQ